MANSFVTFFVPAFYLIAQIAALRTMPDRWQSAAVIPVFVMSIAVALYAVGIALNWSSPEAMVAIGIPASALYLGLLWTGYLLLRSRIEA